MKNPIKFIKYGDTGTLADFNKTEEDIWIYGEEDKIVSELLEAKLEEIILTTSDEDFEFCEQHIRGKAKLLKVLGGCSLLEYNGLKFVYVYCDGGLECYFFVKKDLTSCETCKHLVYLETGESVCDISDQCSIEKGEGYELLESFIKNN